MTIMGKENMCICWYELNNKNINFFINLTSVCPCIVSITVNDDQQDATILVYLFIYS